MRLRTLGLALVAVFAMSAVAASAASAALPEFVPVGGFPVTFTSTSGVGTLETASGNKVECKKDKNVGEVTGAKADHATITFEECSATIVLFKATCTSTKAGTPTGDIISEVNSELVYTNKAKKEVGLLLTPKSPPLFAEFKCTLAGISSTLVVQKSIIGTVGAADLNVKIKAGTGVPLGFKQKKGTQEPNKYDSTPEAEKETLTEANLETEGKENKAFAFEKSGIETTDSLVFNKEAEIKA